MILSITLNPSIDKIYILHSLKIRRVNRVKTLPISPGGKGINAALALNSLGVEVVTMGFIGGVAGRFVEENLREKNLTTNFVYINEVTRVNHIILNRNEKFQSQILEEGPYVEEDNVEEFLKRYERTLTHSEIVIIGGSLPRNIDPNIYRQLVEIAQNHNVKSIVYAYGDHFDEALKQGPTWIMPDLLAGDKVLGLKVNTLKRKQTVAEKILNYGSEAIFFGPENLNYTVFTNKDMFEAKAPSLEVENIVGTGDAFIGYLASQIQANISLEDAVRFGAAASAVCATKIEKELEDPQEVENFLPNIKIEQIAK